MITRFYDVTLITPTRLIPSSAIDVENGLIKEVYSAFLPEENSEANTLNCFGAYAAAGFVDIHVHGGGGVEFMNATPEQICKGCLAHARHGTTTILPTTLAANTIATKKMINSVKKAQRLISKITIAGVHLEGPFLSAAQSGAQSPDALSEPTLQRWNDLLSEWESGVRLVGAAPELIGSLELGDALKQRNITASIAHSDAEFSHCMAALDHGYTDITHIYSGCSTVRRKNGYRFGGVVEAGLLDDRFTVQMIADAKHLPAELLKLIFKCKGPDKISLITDALFAAASDYEDGTVLKQANGMEAVLEDGVMKLPDRQAFAGSIATMDTLVRNMVKLAGVSLCDAVTMATATPARVIGLSGKKGSIKAGYDADIVLLDNDLNIKSVMALGEFID